MVNNTWYDSFKNVMKGILSILLLIGIVVDEVGMYTSSCKKKGLQGSWLFDLFFKRKLKH